MSIADYRRVASAEQLAQRLGFGIEPPTQENVQLDPCEVEAAKYSLDQFLDIVQAAGEIAVSPAFDEVS